MPKYDIDPSRVNKRFDNAQENALSRIQQSIINTGFDPYEAIDGDTVMAGRIAGYDTMESFDSEKSRKLAEQLGITQDEQKRIGLAGKKALQDYMSANQSTNLVHTDYDKFGRPILQNQDIANYMIGSGVAVPTDRYDAKGQQLYRASQDKREKLFGKGANELFDKQREYNIERQNTGFLGSLRQSPAALMSGAQQLLAGGADFVADAVTSGNSTYFEKAKSAEESNKNWGYDTREQEFRTAEAVHKAKNGDWIGAITTASVVAPEVLSQSMPTIATMFVPATGVVKAGSWALGAARSAKVANAINETRVLKNVADIANKNAGFATVVGITTNNDIEEYTKNNDGVEPSIERIAGMTALNTLQLGIDKFVFKDIVSKYGSPSKFVSTMKDAVKILPDNVVVKTAAMAARASLAAGEEFAQEYAQTWAEILNQKLETTKYGSFENLIKNPELLDEALGAGLIGAGTGGMMSLGASTVQGVPAAIDMANEKVGAWRANTKLSADEKRAVELAGGNTEDEVQFTQYKSFEKDIAEDEKEFRSAMQRGEYEKSEAAIMAMRDKYVNYGFEQNTPDEVKAVNKLGDMLYEHREAVARKLNGEKNQEGSVSRLQKALNAGVPLDSQELGSDRRALGYAIDFGVESENAEQIAELAKALGLEPRKIEQYVEEQNAIKALKAQAGDKKRNWTGIKSMEQVEYEAVNGPDGYVTNYGKMKTAQALGNKAEEEKYLAKLQHFLGTQTEKYNRLADAIAKVESGEQAKVEVNYSVDRNAQNFTVSQEKIGGAKNVLNAVGNTVKELTKLVTLNGGTTKQLSEYEAKEKLRTSESQPIKTKTTKPATGAQAPVAQKKQEQQKESKPVEKPSQKPVQETAQEDELAEMEYKSSMQNEYKQVKEGEKQTAENEAGRADKKWKRMIALKNEKVQVLARKTKGIIDSQIVIDKTTNWQYGDANKILERVGSYVGDKLVLNNDVAEAMAIAYISWIAHDADRTIAPNKKEMAQMIGVKGEPTQQQIAMLSGKGVLQKNIVRSLGRMTLEQLDIDFEKEADYKEKINLETALGNILFAAMVNRGIIKQTQVSAQDFNKVMKLKGEDARRLPVAMARFNAQGDESTAYIKAVKNVMKDIKDVLIKSENVSGPNYEITEPNTNHKIRKRDSAKVSKQDEERLQAQERIEHRVKMNVVEAFNKLGEYGKTALGYVSEEDVRKMHKTKRLATKASNDAIIRYMNQMKEHVNTAQDKPYTFNYFMSADGRDMIDSNTFNPQTIKAHRHVDYTGKPVEIDPKTDSRELLYFKTAVLQGLEEKVEKMNEEQINKRFDEVTQDKKTVIIANQLIGEMRNPKAIAEFIGEKAQMHTLDALVALGEYMKAKREGTTFETNLQLEVDAVTSGWILALLQSPAFEVNTVKEMLRKGGVYIDDMNADYANISGNKLEDDSYVTLQKEIQKRIDAMKANGEVSEAFMSILEVDRNFAKAPFMTHIVYGAGIGGTLNDIENQYIEQLYEKLANGQVKEVQNALRSIGVVAQINQPLNFEFLPEQEKTIREKVRDTYGKATKEAIGAKFSKFTEVRDLINKAFKEMFTPYEAAYNKWLNELRSNKEVVTVRDLKKLERDLAHLIPTIKSPNGTDVQIFSKEKIESVIPDELKVQTKFKNKYDGENRSITTEGEMKRIAASATSGGVNPIHFIDGSIIGELLKQFQMTGVYDAGLFSLNDVDNAVELYNKTLIEKSENYNFVEQVLKAGENLGLTDETREGLTKALVTINANRAKLFGSPINAQHFAMNGIAYKREGNTNAAEQTEDTTADELGLSEKAMNKLETMSSTLSKQQMDGIMLVLKQFKECK